jgi:hypothetical protein
LVILGLCDGAIAVRIEALGGLRIPQLRLRHLAIAISVIALEDAAGRRLGAATVCEAQSKGSGQERGPKP